jgi:uncharacterized protein
MFQPTLIKLREQSIWLSPGRCLYWEEDQSLILSDLHFGKTGHFRKSGIAIPQNVFKEDLQRLVQQIQFFKPARLIIVGDFTHSHNNAELELFSKWRKDMGQTAIQLIRGNHDILSAEWYQDTGIEVVEQQLHKPPFCFVHDPDDIPVAETGHYIFSGHLHPGVHLSGLGKQSLSFPCFHFSGSQALLPAFSHFTGYKMINKKKEDRVFAIVNKSLVEV